MKAMLVFALLTIGLIAHAQEPTAVSLSQAEAVREFPALGQPDSNFNKRFVERFKSLKLAGDSLLLRDDWPEVLAREVAVELGVAPLVAATATPAPTAPPTPWQPMGTLLDQRPGGEETPDSQQPVGETLLDTRPQELYHIIGTVLEKVPEGLVVNCNPPGGRVIGRFGRGIVLLKDSPKYDAAASGDSINCWGTLSDNYTYVAPNGFQSVVHSYKYSQ